MYKCFSSIPGAIHLLHFRLILTVHFVLVPTAQGVSSLSWYNESKSPFLPILQQCWLLKVPGRVLSTFLPGGCLSTSVGRLGLQAERSVLGIQEVQVLLEVVTYIGNSTPCLKTKGIQPAPFPLLCASVRAFLLN